MYGRQKVYLVAISHILYIRSHDQFCREILSCRLAGGVILRLYLAHPAALLSLGLLLL